MYLNRNLIRLQKQNRIPHAAFWLTSIGSETARQQQKKKRFTFVMRVNNGSVFVRTMPHCHLCRCRPPPSTISKHRRQNRIICKWNKTKNDEMPRILEKKNENPVHFVDPCCLVPIAWCPKRIKSFFHRCQIDGMLGYPVEKKCFAKMWKASAWNRFVF